MPTRLLTYSGGLFLVLLLFSGLSGCALLRGVGQDTGNGTPAVLNTTTPLPTAPASARGSTYAYIAENQLWVSLKGAAPRKLTSFEASATVDVYWHTPGWSADAHYLAVIVSSQPAGGGGGGCPGPQFGANGALYTLDTSSMQLTRVVVPEDASNARANQPQQGFWQTFFWQDATHLLAWYNGSTTDRHNSTAGLYRYNLATHTLTRVLTLDDLGVATLFNQPVAKEIPLLLSLRYNQGYLYYQEVLQPFTDQSKLLIQRISLAQSGAASQTVLTQSSAGWCTSSTATTYVKPGWDIALDGQSLVAQVITGGKSSVSRTNLLSGESTTLFAGLPPGALGHDLTLAWSPSGKAIAASESHAFSQDGPFCLLLAQPDQLMSYIPAGTGEILWRPDSQAFTVQNTDLAATSATNQLPGPYIYQITQNSQQAQLLLNGASGFAWG